MRFALFLTTAAALFVSPLQATRLDDDLNAFSEVSGEGQTISDLASDVDLDLDAEADMEAMIDADAKLAAAVSAQTEGIWSSLKETFKSWGEDVQKGFEELKKNARGLNLTTMSKMLGNSLANMTVW